MRITIRAVFIATTLLTILASDCCTAQTPSTQTASVIANSVTEFSGEQGKNGWHYGYWDRSADTDGRYSQSSDFKMLKQYGKDARNGLSEHTAFTTGDVWFLEDGVLLTSEFISVGLWSATKTGSSSWCH